MPHYVKECSALHGVMEEVFPIQVAGPLTCLKIFGVVPPDPSRAALAAMLYRTVAARSGDGSCEASLSDLARAFVAARSGLRAAVQVHAATAAAAAAAALVAPSLATPAADAPAAAAIAASAHPASQRVLQRDGAPSARVGVNF